MLNIMKNGYVDMLGGEVDDLENNEFMKPAVFAPKIYKVIDWISSHYDGNHGSTYAHKSGFCVDGKDSIKVAPETYIQISVYQINEAMLDDVDDVMISIPTTAFTSYSFD